MIRLEALTRAFDRWGVPHDGGRDVVAGRPGVFMPAWVMDHHTASDPDDGPAPSRHVVRAGRSDLQGPLCNILVRRDFRVEIVSLGKANHAGKGQWQAIPRDNGNAYALGIEIEHCGTAAEPWSPEFLAFCDLVNVACCEALGVQAASIVAHKEYAPTRKIDPFEWQMDVRRDMARRILRAGPQPRGDDDMQTTDKLPLGAGSAEVLGDADKVITVGEALVIAAASGKATEALTREMLAEIRGLREDLRARGGVGTEPGAQQ